MHLWLAPFSSKDSISPQLKATFAWTWAVTLSGVGEEVSRGGRCCAAGELETSELIAGERSERSGNLARGDLEGIAKACNAEDAGTEVGGGMRCRSSTTKIRVSPRAKIVKKKKKPTQPNQSLLQANPKCHHLGCSSNSSVTSRLLPSSPQSHDAPTSCASCAASCPRPALAMSRLCSSLW